MLIPICLNYLFSRYKINIVETLHSFSIIDFINLKQLAHVFALSSYFSDLLGYSAIDQSSYHLVPDICANQNTSICYEKKRCGPLWNTKNSYFPRQAVGCLIKSETSTSCYFPLPNLIDGMNKIELLDTGIHHTIPNELSFNVKKEPMEQEVRVDFLNLKDVYFKQDLQSSDHNENPDKIEDSILYMRLIPRCKVNGVKVYLKEFHDDVSIQSSEGKRFGLFPYTWINICAFILFDLISRYE
jgi:hypothetical protein